MLKKITIALILSVFVVILCWIHPPTLAASLRDNQWRNYSNLPVLTTEQLAERVESLEISDGIPTIDLREFIVDLTPENREFRDRFYQSLQTELNRSSAAVALDLSHSIIKGEFFGTELGLRAPLYGDALLPLFPPEEQEQLQRDRSRLLRLSQLSRSLVGVAPESVQIAVFKAPVKLVQTRFTGSVHFNNTFFLDRLEAMGATFEKNADFSEARFSYPALFYSSIFADSAEFRGSIFFQKAGFNRVQFQQGANFQKSGFKTTGNFNQVKVSGTGNFSRTLWENNADFSGSQWEDRALFSRANFTESLFLTETTFEKLASFREARFNKPVNLRGGRIRDRLALSDATFSRNAWIEVAGLSFESDTSEITGDPGQIGKKLSVTTLQGNETLLRQLVRNFREQEQIADANQIEYMREKLRQKNLRQRIFGVNINRASIKTLRKLGLSPLQIKAIANAQQERLFGTLNELLTIKEIDLATYVKLRDRAIAGEPLSLAGWLRTTIRWLGVSVLLLLSCYGSSFWLVFGVGIVTLSYFGLLFWFVDRYRPFQPQPQIPTVFETAWILGIFSFLSSAGILAIFRTSDRPGLTLACLAILFLPIPALLLWFFYRQSPHIDSLEISYFVEDGGIRQLRLAIGRLPIIPRFAFFRDRYLPILSERRWNWLNYYDFSLNNLLKFGFNDIRVRDKNLPGLISTLVWYQWSLGILYLTLLLWTLSRTIPGLNLLIYLK